MTDSIDEDDYVPRSSLPGFQASNSAHTRGFIFTESDLLAFIARLKSALPRLLFFDADQLAAKAPGKVRPTPREVVDLAGRTARELIGVIPFRAWQPEFETYEAPDGKSGWRFKRHPGLSFRLTAPLPEAKHVAMPEPFGNVEVLRYGAVSTQLDRRDSVPVKQEQRIFRLLRRGAVACKRRYRGEDWREVPCEAYWVGPDALAWFRAAPGRLLSAYRGLYPRERFVVGPPDWKIASFRPAPRTDGSDPTSTSREGTTGSLPCGRSRYVGPYVTRVVMTETDLDDFVAEIAKREPRLTLIDDFDPAQPELPKVRIFASPRERTGASFLIAAPPPGWTPELERVLDPETREPRWQFRRATGRCRRVTPRTAPISWNLPPPIGPVAAHEPSLFVEIDDSSAETRGLSGETCHRAFVAITESRFFEIVRFEPDRVRHFRTGPSYHRICRDVVRSSRPGSGTVAAVMPWNDSDPMWRIEVFVRPGPEPRDSAGNPYEEVLP